jgi:hypothetical protein
MRIGSAKQRQVCRKKQIERNFNLNAGDAQIYSKKLLIGLFLTEKMKLGERNSAHLDYSYEPPGH